MTIRVLIVDDSKFICNRVREILEEDMDFRVAGIARNGLEAITMAATHEPDVITMDVEMPVMDGITAVRRIMAETPVPILMFSASTHVGAKSTLDALEAGAIDFLPKQLDEIDGNQEMAKRLLRRRVRTVAMQSLKVKSMVFNNHQQRRMTMTKKAASSEAVVASAYSRVLAKKQLRCLVVVASTGGPVAIQKVLVQIPAECSIPIIIVQHMPKNFTQSFAERLNQQCQINVREAVDGDILKPGLALLGPGGMQMQIKQYSNEHCISLRNKQSGEIYAPCADITLTSVAQQFRDRALAVVLTGMGSDGKEGAAKLKQAGSRVWAQNEESCTIYGMPKAIVEAELADQIYSLSDIASELGKIN